MTLIDKFKINWTERSRGRLITSVTGYSYQLKTWKNDYIKKYSAKNYYTKVLAEVPNPDGTITMTISRELN
jgi:hypothetical protein